MILKGRKPKEERRVCGDVSRVNILSLLSTNAGEGVEKREPSYTVGGNVNWYNHYGKLYGNYRTSI